MKKTWIGLSYISAFLVFTGFGMKGLAQSKPSPDEINAELEKFQKDSKTYMFQATPKWDENGKRVSRDDSFFSKKDRKTKRYVFLKNHSKNPFPIAPVKPQPTAPIEPGDDPSKFVDQFTYDHLESMEQDGYQKGEVSQVPWSDTYWPIARGVIANRFADPDYPDSSNWKSNYDYMKDRVGKGVVDQLSPAEKYDLLIGDSSFTLTHQMFEEGRMYFDKYGEVESWMGICHGWAPASYSVSRPAHAVLALAADGVTRILFYPSDLKALTTLLWANGSYSNRFMGQRCSIKSPRTDENGRVIEPACFDSNPGSWHMAIVNQVGFSKRSFVMDATYDYQVWNQPVISYRYTYFNPQTNKAVDRISEAKVALNGFSQDKFKKYRGPQATDVVGVAMDVTYGQESEPTSRSVDRPEYDHHRTVRYLYDLELNSDGKVVGGEWYSNLHPDFLWGPSPGAAISTAIDENIDQSFPGVKWTGEESVPVQWRKLAREASVQSLPLAHIVEVLMEKAR